MKKDLTYSLELTITKNMDSVCSCTAGRGPHGSCKHLAALCFVVEDFSKVRTIALEQGEESCTSLLQKWNQPRKRRLDLKKVKDISFSSFSFGKSESTTNLMILDLHQCARQHSWIWRNYWKSWSVCLSAVDSFTC